MSRWITLALLLLTGSGLHAQTIGVQAGASTLFGAEGASATIYTANTNSTFGVGLSNGRLVASATTEFLYRGGWDVSLGDRNIFLSTEQLGLSSTVRGLEADRKRNNSDLAFFAGAVGQSYSTPWFSGERTDSVGAGLLYSRTFSSVKLTTIEAWSHGRLTALEGGAWHWRGLEAKGTAGLLERRAYFIGQGSWKLPHASLDGSRQTYIWQGQRSTVTGAGVAAWYGPVDAHANIFRSTLALGKTAGAGLHVGPLTVREDVFLSRGSRTLSTSITEQYSRHWSLSQFITRSGGSTSLNFGAGYTSNVVTASVGYSQQFIPFGRVPFAKVLTVGLSFQLPHGSTLNVATVAAPDGGSVRWTTYGGTFVQAPWLSSPQDRGTHVRKISGTEFKGRVVDQYGSPVQGAAIVVSGQTTYSDSTGSFTARLRKHDSATILVDVDNFSAPGSWTLVSCPQLMQAGTMVEIVVRRK